MQTKQYNRDGKYTFYLFARIFTDTGNFSIDVSISARCWNIGQSRLTTPLSIKCYLRWNGYSKIVNSNCYFPWWESWSKHLNWSLKHKPFLVMLDVFVLLPKGLHFCLKIRQKVCIVLVVEETTLIQSRNNLQTINIFLFFLPQFLC